MEIVKAPKALLFILSSIILFAGYTIDALSYDHSATIECLKEPLKPQYSGGIIVNPEFSYGLKGWSSFGGNGGKIMHKTSEDGNSFIVAHSRNQPYDTFSQKIYLHKENLYAFSAWIQVSHGKGPVTAVFKTTDGFTYAGSAVARSGCWSMLKGGLTVDSSGYAELYFQSNNTNAEIWVDNVSLQPFTKEQWRSHQVEGINKARKRDVKVHVIDSKGETLQGANIHFRPRQNKASFPFGCVINKDIIGNQAAQNWFLSRFSVTVFGNELKWYATERFRGVENYTDADAMLAFAKQNGIPVRGHCIFWDDPDYQPKWVPSLSPEEIKDAAYKRLQSVVSRYSGQFINWDVNNENLHFQYFEQILGANASDVFFQMANQLDPATRLFMNEFNTLEWSGDTSASPAQYVAKLQEIGNFYQGPRGIGLESHFGTPNIPYVRAALDTLASAGVPIWLTELDVSVENGTEMQASYLEQILREAHSHTAVEGIVLWAARNETGCYRMCLTDENYNNLPTGVVVDKLIDEWKPQISEGLTDSNGEFKTLLFHGHYDVAINHPSMNSTFSRRFEVTAPETSARNSEDTTISPMILHVQVDV
ncbi:uncharacterized protein LOC113311181 [Papaver somniferum]|uniref:uncharacterized protein LOC113311181 n=1 Tax=Papaver somniferum TaxID=3469 RepID=UPI000E6FBA3A|nr:uncharacterized protein LOC113311181 [Papaver somniferum]